MELGLYRQPIINFQGPKLKGTTATASSHIFIFQVNLVIFQPRNFLSPPNNFQLFQLSTYLFIQTLLIQP